MSLQLFSKLHAEGGYDIFIFMNTIGKFTPLIIIFAIVGILAAGYFDYKYIKAQKEITAIKTDPTTIQKAATIEAQKLVDQVSKLMELPKGETPTIATVTDVGKLKDQPFFVRAKNGDKVLIYTNAKKAVLYDPATNKIVDVAPVNLGSSSSSAGIK